jgi:hypothetical protein
MPFYVPYFVGYLSLSMIYIAGEFDRRDRAEPLRIPRLSFLKIPLFIMGLACLVLWFVLYRSEIWANLETIFSNWISIEEAKLLSSNKVIMQQVD